MKASGRHEYLLCGWHVRSVFDLPEFLPWSGPKNTPVDVAIHRGAVPEQLTSARMPGELNDVSEDAALVHIPGLVRILIRGGHDITVEVLRQEPGCVSWRCFLSGMALAHLCDQRGIFALHAAALRLGGKTIAITGSAGTDTSERVQSLMQQGAELMADTLTALQTDGAGGVRVLPVTPNLTLWRKSLLRMGLRPEEYPRIRPGTERYLLPVGAAFCPEPYPLDALIVPEYADGGPDDAAIRSLSQAETLVLLMGQDYRRQIRRIAERIPIRMAQANAIARAVPAYVVPVSALKDFVGRLSKVPGHTARYRKDNTGGLSCQIRP